MEGFTNNTNVANYEILAKYYDELLSNEEDLSLWIDYVKQKDCKDISEEMLALVQEFKKMQEDFYEKLKKQLSKV